ncbi:hypothetical protein Tco_0619336 [Tanacetum coccineum]
MQSSADRFLRRNIPPSGNNRPSSNYRKGRKEQNGANRVCNNKISFVVQHHNRKDRNEKPESDSWKGCKPRTSEPARNDGDHVESRLQTVINKRALGKHGSIRMGQRRPMTPDRRQALKETVFRWLKEGTIRKVQHPEWVANTIHVKLANGTWKVQVDYSSLNKVCAKDMYPFPDEGEELASLMEYPYKCFLRLPKEYSQIRMAENEEEKTGGVGSEEVSYRRRGILFHPHAERIKKLSGDTSEDDGKGLGRSKRAKRESIPGRNSNEKQKKHKVAVVAVGPMEEILKLPGRDGRLAKWAVEVWTYDISYIQRKEAEGSVVKKFFGQEEQVQETPDANEEETSKRFKQKQP